MIARSSGMRWASSSIARATSWCAWATVSAGLFLKQQAQADQEQMGQDRVRHVMMPTAPSPRLIVIHADFALAFFEGGFHWPTHATHTDEFVQRTGRGGVAQIKLHFGLRPQTAAEDGPTARSGKAIAHGRHA